MSPLARKFNQIQTDRTRSALTLIRPIHSHLPHKYASCCPKATPKTTASPRPKASAKDAVHTPTNLVDPFKLVEPSTPPFFFFPNAGSLSC